MIITNPERSLEEFNADTRPAALLEKYKDEIIRRCNSYYGTPKQYGLTEYGDFQWILDMRRTNPENYRMFVDLKLRIPTVDTQRGIRFYIEPYDACCGIEQINHFMYGNLIPDEMVGELMDCLMSCLTVVSGQACRRVVFNFIEAQSKNGARYREDKRIYQFGDINIPVETTDMNMMSYRALYTWATSKRSQQLLTVNHRTGNIIHFVDCMFGY